jgi:hypothetical protein
MDAMVKPDLFYFRETSKGVGLCASELSTSDALKMFAGAAPITITDFGAIPANDRQGWTSLKDLPPLATVESVISFLSHNDRMELIDFSASIGGDAMLSTHDDGEADFQFSDGARAIGVLQALLGQNAAPNVAETILENSGKYVSLENGEVAIFPTFDSYLKKSFDP